MNVVDTHTCFKAYDVRGKLNNVESRGDAVFVTNSIEQINTGSY